MATNVSGERRFHPTRLILRNRLEVFFCAPTGYKTAGSGASQSVGLCGPFECLGDVFNDIEISPTSASSLVHQRIAVHCAPRAKVANRQPLSNAIPVSPPVKVAAVLSQLGPQARAWIASRLPVNGKEHGSTGGESRDFHRNVLLSHRPQPRKVGCCCKDC